MVHSVLVPQVGQDLTECKVVALNIKVGDTVAKGDIVAEVESEKATFEVESFESGVVLDVHYKVGDIATVLAPLLSVGERGETPRPQAPVSQAAPALVSGAATEPVNVLAALSPVRSVGSQRASPLARRLAMQHGIDLSVVSGTGPRGHVVKRDIDPWLANGAGQLAHSRSLATTVPEPARAVQAVRSLRNGSGDPVIFIHGFGADLSAWRPLIGHLHFQNPALALDLPAHGASPAAGVTNFETLVEEVRRLLAAAAVQRLHLVGHSLGAAVAAALTRTGGLDVRSMTLLAPAGLGPRINGDFIDGYLAAASEAALDAWMRILVGEPSRLPSGLVRATLEARRQAPLVDRQRQLAAVLFDGHTQLFSVRDALISYQGPLRIVAGRDDAIIPPPAHDLLPPHVALHALSSVGHLPQVEATDLVARLITETVRAAG